jgi:hypothetical protein
MTVRGRRGGHQGRQVGGRQPPDGYRIEYLPNGDRRIAWTSPGRRSSGSCSGSTSRPTLLADVAVHLNESGYPSPTHQDSALGRHVQDQVGRVLRGPLLPGQGPEDPVTRRTVQQPRDAWVEVAVPPDHRRGDLRRTLAKRDSRATSGAGSGRGVPLRGFIVCAECGSTVHHAVPRAARRGRTASALPELRLLRVQPVEAEGRLRKGRPHALQRVRAAQQPQARRRLYDFVVRALQVQAATRPSSTSRT